MLRLLILAGLSTVGLGFASTLDDPALLQGALTLGGGWLICAAFTRYAYWHGVIGAGILALLAAARCAPALPSLLTGDEPAAPFQAAAFGISAVVLVQVVRQLRRERARRQREALDAGGRES